MNKRQRKKRDKKLYRAIYELNKMLAEDLEVEFVEDGLQETFERVKSNPKSIQKTFADYKRFLG
ncbi:hypothetical protein D3C76_1688240 [compost metagenome]